MREFLNVGFSMVFYSRHCLVGKSCKHLVFSVEVIAPHAGSKAARSIVSLSVLCRSLMALGPRTVHTPASNAMLLCQAAYVTFIDNNTSSSMIQWVSLWRFVWISQWIFWWIFWWISWQISPWIVRTAGVNFSVDFSVNFPRWQINL